MPFLIIDDYLPLIKAEALAAITNNNDDIQARAENAAQALISSYLNQRYNVDEIFSAILGDRNPLIVLYMVDITLYEIYSRIDPRQIPDIRFKRYTDAMEWLKMVQQGKLTPPALPLLQTTDGENTNQSRYGSRLKFGGEW